MVLVGEHGLDVTPDQGEEQRHAQAGGDQVEQGGLGVFVNMHHGDCSQEASQVRCKKVKDLQNIPVLSVPSKSFFFKLNITKSKCKGCHV